LLWWLQKQTEAVAYTHPTLYTNMRWGIFKITPQASVWICSKASKLVQINGLPLSSVRKI